MSEPDSPPRILVLATSLARTSGGGLTFLNGLLGALHQSPDVTLLVVYPKGHELAWGQEKHIVNPRVGMVRVVRDLMLAWTWTRRFHADLVLTPHEWTPPTGSVPSVNVLQNILYLHPEGRVTSGRTAAAMRSIIRCTARFADTTVCVSTESRNLWKEVSGNQTILLPEGIDDVFAASSPSRGLASPITIVSGDSPHKHPEFARRLALRLQERGIPVPVSCVGFSLDGGPGHPIPAADLAELFAKSRAVVLTSTIESFGLPAFEARHTGAWVMANEGTAMAEWLAADPGTVVLPRLDERAFVSAIETSLERQPPPLTSTFTWNSVGTAWAHSLVQIAEPARVRCDE